MLPMILDAEDDRRADEPTLRISRSPTLHILPQTQTRESRCEWLGNMTNLKDS